MTNVLGRTTLTLLLIIFCGVVFHAPLSVWLGTMMPGLEVELKAWKEVLLAVAVMLLVVDVTRRQQWRQLSKDWLLRIALAYVLIHMLMLPLFWQGVLPTVAGLLIDLRFVAFFVVVYVAVRLYPEWRRPLLIGGGVAAAVSMLFAFLQVTVLPYDVLTHIGYDKETTIAPYLTVDQNYDYIRINGTLRGPNPLGLYAGLVAAVSAAMLLMYRSQLQRRSRYLPWAVGVLGGISLAAVWFSYSRSALIATALAIGVVGAVYFGRKLTRSVWVALGASMLLLVGGLYVAQDTAFVSHVILHEDPHEGNDVNSNDGHVASLIEGAERMVRQPLGAGIGSTGSPSLMGEQPLIIENHYLYIAHEVGWPGLAVFIALFGVVLWKLWQRRSDWLALSVLASGVGIAVAGLFLPVWADDTVALVWWGLAGVAVASTVSIKEKRRHNG